MSRLDNLSQAKHPILTCYLPIGDPMALPYQAEIYAQEGVDVYEVGIPCPDPFLDGDLVKSSMQRVLRQNVKQKSIAKMASRIRLEYPDKSVVMMGYQNLRLDQLLLNGKAEFDALLQVGPAGNQVDPELEVLDVRRICFIPHAIRKQDLALARECSGYVMLQAASGKTGLRNDFDLSNKSKIERLRDSGVIVPILLGVGISNAKQAQQAIECGADGVIIGSACLAKMQQGESELRRFLSGIRSALNGLY
ncbi:MAG: tryptophan synthase subunit alpha [Pseudomonadales bacterium]|nr:tryptophan synthase subunit alpha [Pseudomonadales bacterium]